MSDAHSLVVTLRTQLMDALNERESLISSSTLLRKELEDLLEKYDIIVQEKKDIEEKNKGLRAELTKRDTKIADLQNELQVQLGHTVSSADIAMLRECAVALGMYLYPLKRYLS